MTIPIRPAEPHLEAELLPPSLPIAAENHDVFLALDFFKGQFRWDTLASMRVATLTHCPVSTGFFARCHAIGVRCYPYVTPYVGATQVMWNGVASSTYQGIDFGAHHFWETGPDGSAVPSVFNDPQTGITNDGVGVQLADCKLTCPNVAAYQDAICAYVDHLMSLGADGVFVDNLLARQECHGAKLGKHPHVIGGQAGSAADQTQAFGQLIGRIRETVRHRRADGLVLGNSGQPLNWAFPQHIDSDAIESYGVGAPMGSYGVNLSVGFTWDDIGTALHAYGKPIFAFAPCITKREQAFVSFARARLEGFVWCGSQCGGGVLPDGPWADLYRVRLGPALTPKTNLGHGVRYRRFALGIVAVNDSDAAAAFVPPGRIPPLYDLFAGGFATQVAGAPQIPAGAGRVYLYGSPIEQASMP